MAIKDWKKVYDHIKTEGSGNAFFKNIKTGNLINIFGSLKKNSYWVDLLYEDSMKRKALFTTDSKSKVYTFAKKYMRTH